MNRDALTLALIFAVLATVVIFKYAPPNIPELTVAPDDDGSPSVIPNAAKTGPTYQTYNAPYFFAPPVSNFLPSQAAPGQGGAAVNVAMPFAPCNTGCGKG